MRLSAWPLCIKNSQFECVDGTTEHCVSAARQVCRLRQFCFNHQFVSVHYPRTLYAEIVPSWQICGLDKIPLSMSSFHLLDQCLRDFEYFRSISLRSCTSSIRSLHSLWPSSTRLTVRLNWPISQKLPSDDSMPSSLYSDMVDALKFTYCRYVLTDKFFFKAWLYPVFNKSVF